MAHMRWKESYCWDKLGTLDTRKALQVLKYYDKVTLNHFLRGLSSLARETSINGEGLKNFVSSHKPIINLILCGGMPFDSNEEVPGMNSQYEHIHTKEWMLVSIGFHVKFCECFLLSVLGRHGAWESSLKDISLDGDSYSLSKDEMVALCANLSSNSNVRSLDLRKQTLLRFKEGCRLLGQALRTNSVLEKLFLPSSNLSSTGVQQLMDGLREGSMSNMQVLDLSMNPSIEDTGIFHIAKMLKSSKKLKILHLKGTGCGLEGARVFSSALLVNSTLELLSFGTNPITEEGMKLIFSSLTPDLDTSRDCRSNSTLKHLELEYMELLHYSVESLATMITSNRTLESLNMTGVLIDERDWTELVIPALYYNNTLKFLAVSGSKILPLDSLAELMRSMSKKTLRSGVLNQELKVNRLLRTGLHAPSSVRPQFERIILCGYKLAGKTTISNTMRYLTTGPPAFHHCNVTWKKFSNKVILAQKRLFRPHALGKGEARSWGCDVLRFIHEANRTTDVWDFAGHKEYFALHQTLFSNFSNSCFLYICSPLAHMHGCHQSSKKSQTSRRIKDQRDIQEELEYWIRFTASNSRHFQSGSIYQHVHRPRIIFVLTNKDELNEGTLRYVSKSAEHVVAEMKERYHSVVDLEEFVPVVDSHSCEDVGNLIRLAERCLVELSRQSTESAALEQVRLLLENWAMRNASTSFMSLADFKSLCEEEVGKNLDSHVFSAAKLHSKEGQVVVLNQLNIVGDIIFPSSCDHFVVNPRRFGLEVLGPIIKALRGAQLESNHCDGVFWVCKTCLNKEDGGMGLYHEKGFVRTRHLKEIADSLGDISWTDFLSLLIHLELCFETTTDGSDKNTTKVFVPAVFDDVEETALLGRRQLKWTENIHRHDFHYDFIGRRLECDTTSLSVFRPGFFPRLQVFLHNYFMAKGWLGNQAFQLDRNLIGFYENGVEVLVEYSGVVSYFVDILVKSSQPVSYTLDFIQVNVIEQILKFCSSPKGCPGVVLVESVIRNLCVKELHLCVDRIHQSVLVSTLHDRIRENGFNYRLAWSESIDRASSNVENAVELLGGENSPLLKSLQTPSGPEADGSETSSAQKTALLDHDRPQSGSTADTTSIENAIQRGLQQVGPQEITSQPFLRIYQSAIDPCEQQDRPSTSSLGEDKQPYNEKHLPCLFYPTFHDVGYLSSLWAKIEAKKAVKIHLMCESPSGFHEVVDQQGRILNLVTGRSTLMEQLLTFIRHALTGTATLAGMDVDASWFQGLFGTSLNMPIKIEDLLRIKDRYNPSAAASDNEILASLAMYLKVERSTQWLRDFLNMENGNAFRHDFNLWKVQNLNTNSIAWVCVQHYMQVVRKHNQLCEQQS